MRSPVILVVDDNETIRKVVRIILKSRGFRVLLAPTGRNALQICDRFSRRIDLLLVDIKMPGMSGFELVDETARILPELPVLLMSCSFLEDDPEMSGRAFIAKPFTHGALIAKIQALVGQASQPSSNLYKTASRAH